MKLIRYIFIFSFLFSTVVQTFSQQVPIGQWRDELPYTLVNSITDAGTRIYASTPYAVFYVDKEDNSVTRITKISGLSDIGISSINYNKEYKTLVIAYTNANIDLIKNNVIINISDIKRKPILGNKTINNIFFIGKDAYLSCGFGIVVLDLNKEEIRDTYYIGKDGGQINVLALSKDQHDTLFAATEKGIYIASVNNPNLSNFTSWRKDSRLDSTATYNSMTLFAGKIFVNKKRATVGTDTILIFSNGSWERWQQPLYSTVMHLQSNDKYLLVAYNFVVKAFGANLEFFSYVQGSEYPQDAIADSEGIMWVGDTYLGLASYNPATQAINRVNLSGPATALAFSMSSRGNDLYIAPGGRDGSFIPIYTRPQVYHLKDTEWKNLEGYNNPIMNQTHDVVTIAIDPNDSKHAFAGTYGKGVLEIYNDSVIRRFTYGNSTLRNYSGSDTSDIRVGGVAYDAAGNLWVVTSFNNNCISMKKGDKWTTFSVPIENDLGFILVDRHGQKWIQMRYGTMNANSILVFTENGTPDNPLDDKFRLLNSTAGNGNIPGTTVLTMAEDKKGEIWVGTEKGVAVFYAPENVFSGQNFDAQQILVTQGSYVQYLLENETVTAIAIDGANQKWIGTDRGGVFLFSEDGTKEIFHFTAENSPLLSNRITCIALNDDGNVFFGTDNGVISYRGSATPGGEGNENVYAFPNPVRENYEGCIAVRGLVNNAQVKITDINGTLVYSGYAGNPQKSDCESLNTISAQTGVYGGQVVWDGRNFDGRKARTGVYLVYASDDTGSEKVVTKILIIH
ncbi:MAG: two-component regulator propeller domain-containing protein [Bacteroidales bacterium]|nr:two-component regulator propeller domain-containing protein [Bacteroidales bacterium]